MESTHMDGHFGPRCVKKRCRSVCAVYSVRSVAFTPKSNRLRFAGINRKNVFGRDMVATRQNAARHPPHGLGGWLKRNNGVATFKRFRPPTFWQMLVGNQRIAVCNGQSLKSRTPICCGTSFPSREFKTFAIQHSPLLAASATHTD